ncbi:MAG TPA: hypothetical protein VIS55_14690 [Pseudomonadales bacterium]|jgi:hypothetical protein
MAVVLAMGCAANAIADEEAVDSLQFEETFGFDISQYQLDDYTEVTGWRLSDRWYFGRQKGVDSGLGFVWQDEADQMSISTNGIRFTRRF